MTFSYNREKPVGVQPEMGMVSLGSSVDRDVEEGFCKHYVAGQWCEPEVNEWFDVTNSSTGEVVARTPLSSLTDIEPAIQAAAEAFPQWAETSVSERVRILYNYKKLLEENLDHLARTIVIENGKTLDEARAELCRGIEVVELACATPMLIKGQTLDNVRGIDYQTTRCPLGVCAGIGAFNFPFMIPHWMFPVALACGNTFVFKPSHQTPLTTLAFAPLLEKAGLPPGVFNVVHGAKRAVDALQAHPLVRAVSFVGSTAVSQYVYRTGSANGKRVQAEGGAKNHFVVMPDAPIDRVVREIVSGAFGSAGARCMATSTVVLVGGAGDKLVAPLRQAAAELRVGRTDTDTVVDMGPLVSAEHKKRVVAYIERGQEEGAELILDGRDVYVPGAPRGFFLGPTLFDYVRPEHTIAREEIFGPVLSIMHMDTLDEAIAQINQSPYGNAVCIYTRDAQAARRFRNRVNVGMVGINVGVPAPAAFFSFAGWKASFFGDLHVQGTECSAFYTQEKVISTRWI